MEIIKIKKILIYTVLLLCFANLCQAQKIQLGAYYFDGWGGQKRQKLSDNFPERKPIWGWQTSKPEIVEKQIDAAADAGISFFTFCWYYKKNPSKQRGIDNVPFNNALNLYLKASNKKRLKFNILVSNHEGFRINANDWENLCQYWCSLFKDESYLLIDNKPSITFFDIKYLYKTFGSDEKLIAALNLLRDTAKKNGLDGVSIGASVSSVSLAEKAAAWGFDFMTGYNYHGAGLWNRNKSEVVPIREMKKAEVKVWNDIATASNKPIIPTITLNWDRRPLDKIEVKRSPRFYGYSPKSVEEAVTSCKNWMLKNQKYILKENIAVLYAWNEYGEGAWLTPTVQQKDSLLNAVKRAIKN